MSGTRLAPHASDAKTPIEFVALMRRLQQWSGLTIHELESRATADGDRLPTGRLTVLLDHDILPPKEMVAAFVRACGCSPAVQREWIRIHDRIAAGPADRTAPGATFTESHSGPFSRDESPEGEAPETDDHRPRHRRPHRHRSVSLLVMAPVLITVVIVAISLWPADGPSVGRGAAPAQASARVGSAAPEEAASVSSIGLPTNGWYTVHPAAGRPADECLSVLPDNDFRPTLASDTCVVDDTLQRFRFQAVQGGAYTIKGTTSDDDIWCATVDSRSEGALIHLSSCDPRSVLQRFAVTPASESSRKGPLFRLLPKAAGGMCVGLGARVAGTAQTMQISCGRTGVLEYALSPVASPTGR
ncbi:RICIN domain-containing protein [Actinomadura sp. HBU206391]|uniref:RICIN domain-containing protein n=1 Tax=Actinomadura sp. HBU206391 TaxID=2731692 RepID=UPI00164FF05E|nr:RICIN domain-containing protein [Actinomadura sp. HBU206391]MBC6463581.1 RICIN domain-containing protein [Actinomadura sp. HBU206391]